MRLQEFASTALLALAISAQTITENTVTKGNVVFHKDVNVAEGVFWSIIDNYISKFVGDLNIDGEFYISENHGHRNLDISFLDSLHKIRNSGKIVFSSENSLFPPIYNLNFKYFENSGSLFYSSSGTVGGTKYILQADRWINKPGALVSLSSSAVTDSFATLGGLGGRITNDGQICLSKQIWKQSTEVVGKGCITVGVDSTF